ncbi:MAG: hypothetical protein ACKO4Z_06450 [Planctomycetota bacterium]
MNPVIALNPARPRSLALAIVATAIVALMPGGPILAAADDKKARREVWESFTDDPAVKAYAEQLKAGGFDATSRDTLLTKTLPRLEDPANRRSIERLRRRIRDVMLSERATDATTLEAANAAAAEWLLGRAVAGDVDPVVAVNETLLVGDLRGPDGKPWPGAASRLTPVAANAGAPLAVRAAAVASLVKHVDAGVTLSADAVNGIQTVAFAPPATADAATDWLASRAISLLPAILPKATAETAAAVGKVLGDAARSVDVRIRAAEALGRTVTEDTKLDATAALAAIRAVAIRGLEEDLTRATDEEFGQSLSAGGAMAMAGPGFAGAEFAPRPGGEFGGFAPGMGFGAPGVAPGMPSAPPVEPTVLEHNAWRLATLASAIQPAGKAGGISAVAGDASASAKDLAAKLRENATILHEWIHPPKDTKGKKPAGGEFGFDLGMTPETMPTKQDLGQALREALDDLRATPPFGAAAEAGSPPDSGQAPAAADPFTSP